MSGFETPDGWTDWPFDAKRAHLANATADDLRSEINGIVGLGSPEIDNHSFTKDELAALLLALGGPQEVSAE